MCELAVRTILDRFLRSDGHDVTLTEDGKTGVELFEKEHFDLIIVDRAMISGFYRLIYNRYQVPLPVPS